MPYDTIPEKKTPGKIMFKSNIEQGGFQCGREARKMFAKEFMARVGFESTVEFLNPNKISSFKPFNTLD